MAAKGSTSQRGTTQQDQKASAMTGRGGTGTLLTLGAVTIGAIGILTYAKNDQEFRETLEGWIPGTDRAIQILFQEEANYFEYLINFFNSLKQKILDFLFYDKGSKEGQVPTTVDCKEVPAPYRPPRPAFEPPGLELSPKLPPREKPKPELRLSLDGGEKIETVSEMPPPPPQLTADEKLVPDLHELETYAGKLAAKAIAAFHDAACAVQNYNKDVIAVVESSDNEIGQQVWDSTAKRTDALKEAENTADEAVNTLKELRKSIDDPKFDSTPGQKTITRRNISKILSDVDKAKKQFDKEVANSNISEKYWKSVRTAREKFHEELQILFPNINIDEKKLSVSDEAFDLFVLHMYHKVAYLQKELQKMQTIADAKLRSALKSSGNDEKVKEVISMETEKEKRNLQEEFDKKMLEERKVLDDEMRKQLTLQAQIHADHLREAIATKDREIERKVNRAIHEQKEEESIKTKTQLAAVIGRLRGLDEALKKRLDAEKDASEAQLMWGACQALVRAVKTAPPGTKPENAVRPLDPEIKALTKAAPKDDGFVNAAIEGIPEEAVKRGVYPEDALRERFLKVEEMARKLALVPEEGASLPIYMLSYLQNFLLVKAISPIPKHELDDEPIDVESLNTYDVLQRARYWLDRGDFKMTLRYMNLLKGAPRAVSRDWMNEARILLETQQAIESLVAYAGANSLVFMGGGDSKGKKK